MRISDFIIFLAGVLSVYGLLHTYIFIRAMQAIPAGSVLRHIFVPVFLSASVSYIAGRVIERISVCSLSNLFIWVGSLWLGMLLYLFLFTLLFDIIRGVHHLIPIYPAAVTRNYQRIKFIAAVAVFTASAGLTVAGHINTLFPRLHTLRIPIQKNAGHLRTLRIVLATDIHLGTIISNSRLESLVDRINSCDADIVLLGGDIVDEDLKPVIERNLGEQLRRIRAKYGIFAITGNHEFIGGVEKACRYLTEHGITMLRDKAVMVDGSFYLAGREDRSITRFTGKARKSLYDILAGADRKFPVILLDHQPFALHEADEEGIDLQLSGHTHAGQIWPMRHIVDLIYEVGSGYKKIADTHIYVSSGFGTWGPPVRIGNRPEVVLILLDFK